MNKPLKVRFLKPGNRPYRPSLLSLFVYDHYIRTPGTGLITLAAIARDAGAGTRLRTMCTSISRRWWFWAACTPRSARRRWRTTRASCSWARATSRSGICSPPSLPGFPGLAWRDESGAFRTTGPRRPPCDISTIPDRSLVHRYRARAGHNAL